MKKYKKLFTALFLMGLFFCLSSQTAFAFSESDAQAQVDAAGREAVSGEKQCPGPQRVPPRAGLTAQRRGHYGKAADLSEKSWRQPLSC